MIPDSGANEAPPRENDMLWFLAGLSLGTCLGAVVVGLCLSASGRRPQPARIRRVPAHPFQTRV